MEKGEKRPGDSGPSAGVARLIYFQVRSSLGILGRAIGSRLDASIPSTIRPAGLCYRPQPPGRISALSIFLVTITAGQPWVIDPHRKKVSGLPAPEVRSTPLPKPVRPASRIPAPPLAPTRGERPCARGTVLPSALSRPTLSVAKRSLECLPTDLSHW
jgi:hypothetical protein